MSIQTESHSIKSEIKENLSVSIPLISAQMIYACSGFVGTALVARLGQDALAASVLVNMTWFSISVLFFGLLNSISVLVSHQFGAKNDKAISEIMGQAFVLGFIIVIICLVILSSMPYFLRYTAQPENVLRLAVAYMHSMLWTLPGLITLLVCEQFLAGVNRARIVLRISMMVVPIEIALIYSLIFGKFGLPACGVAGIGYGFAVTYSVTAILLTQFLLRARFFRRYNIFAGFCAMNFAWLKELIRVGLPMGCMNTVEVSTFAITTYWIARFGTTMLAAHQIAMQYLGFAITIVFAMAQAVSIRVGHAVGRGDMLGIRYATYTGMIMNFSCVSVITCAFIFIPRLFLRLDMNIHDPANALLMHDASSLLGIAGVLMLFDNFRIIVGFGSLRSLKDTKFPMYVSIVSFWMIGLSCAYLFAFKFDFGGKGIWAGLTLGIASGAIIIFMRLQYTFKRIDLNKLMAVK